MSFLGTDDVFGTAPRGLDVGVKLSNITLDSITATNITATNTTLRDNATFIRDATDATIRIGFNAAGATGTTATLRTAQTANRTYTIPDSGANADFVTTEGDQTLNGQKTIPTLSTDQITEATPGAGINQTAAFLSLNSMTITRNDGYVQTIDDTPGSSIYIIPTTTNSVCLIRAEVIATTSAGDVALFRISSRVKNIADILTVDAIAIDTWSDIDAPLAGVNADIVAAGTNIVVEVLGLIGLTIDWRAVAIYTTMAF